VIRTLDDARKLFPIGLHFNPDGRFITYVVRAVYTGTPLTTR